MKQIHKANHGKSLVREMLGAATITKASSILKADLLNQSVFLLTSLLLEQQNLYPKVWNYYYVWK